MQVVLVQSEIKRILRISQFASRMWYYVLIAIIFLILAFIFPFLARFGLVNPDLANNLAAECGGISATILLLMFIIELREYTQWRPVRDKVMKTIGKEIYELFTEFVNVCECTHTFGKSRKESFEESFRRLFFIQLEELNKKVELNELGRKYFSRGGFATLYETRAKHLGDIEAKYSRFLGSPLRLSLMEIQDNLNSLSLDLHIKKNLEDWFKSEEQFLKSVSTKIHNIMKEIYKVHKMRIEIYPKQT